MAVPGGGLAAGVPPEHLALELTCPICHELFRAPVVLECSHDFCQECIDRYWGTCCSPGSGYPCPMCKCEHPERRYTSNRTLGRLADAQREQEEGAQAEGLFCSLDHTQVPAGGQCPEHGSQGLVTLQQVVQLYREKMESSLAALKTRLQGLKSMREQQAEKVLEVKGQCLSLEENIQHEFATLHRWLNERELAIIKELRREEELLLEALGASSKTLRDSIQAAEERADQIHSRLEKQDPTDFLADMKSFIAKFCGEENGEISTDPSPAGTGLIQGRFRGPIQYAAWKEMKNAVQPVPSAVTFDPKTSHPRLILSNNLTSMSVGEPEEEALDNPLRFSKSGCVLGSQGIAAGRYYWEVSVANKTSWDIGVAKTSVDRKRIIKLKPENGYWAIWLRNGQEYKALDTPSKCLTLSVPPQRIGVYVDYEAGQVSFYNGDDMSHIYTFKDTFTEVLYPMFGPGVNDGTYNEPVKIIHLKL